ncbi:autophagy-related protein 18b [Andrographis paniculata]|uniref:autophagy-related protein 18b n=1 Tax=Andrographis paniculata TaxID=175694 RepID=UPI0021E7DDB9|nr:autophagy-related protein 18b [Andrographis paniculata]XP_051148603.1 autophagy-related protein 18b [Andrographis paniculata]XP_051148604.1 autophagy-related protein 18b [Andrographis paniculata]XP_051148605.1 autophagy-related protein 18b [Andrographis paniculata]XP_051148606.1 autophagy-related protein 18b [Andrographis paniculata]
MAGQSSPHRILCASFNQDNSCFAVGTGDGFKIFDLNTGQMLHEQVAGAFSIVEMLFKSSLVCIVGAGEQPSLSPRRLSLFDTKKGTALREMNFLTSILAVRVNKQRLIIVLQEKIYIYDTNNGEILHILNTVPNVKGLCAFSANMDNPYLALPASTTAGSVLVYNVMDLQSHCEIDAHRSPLAALAFSPNGMYIATASEQGTIVRVYLVSDATESHSFRRGTCASTIYSLSFGPSVDLPDILLATSSSGSVHIFSLGFVLKERKSKSFFGSIMSGSVSDTSDHLVYHNAFAAGVRSDAIVQKIERISDTSSSNPVALRATVSMITFNGYFQEYCFSINHKHEPTWTLERQFNLSTAVVGQSSS